MSSNKSSPSVEEVIANGQRLVKEAEAVMARSERLFAEHNINPDEMIAALRKVGGDAAVRKVEEQAAALMKDFEEELERNRVHNAIPRTSSKPSRMRNMI